MTTGLMRCGICQWLLALCVCTGGSAAVAQGSGGSGTSDELTIEGISADITIDELRAHVNTLASDTFQGREAGTDGGRAAGAYVLSELRRLNVADWSDGQDVAEPNPVIQEFGKNFRNILVYIPGVDPRLSHEVVVIGAHYDHVGLGTRRTSLGPIGQIHNGADDNASGTTVLLEILERYRAEHATFRRSILFAFWDAEEKGLLGSKHWVSQPTLPLERVVFNINIDMVGRFSNEIEVSGSRTAIDLERDVCEWNTATGKLPLRFTWDVLADSDHHPFFAKDIPFVMYFSGFHDDYHRPTDDANLVNYDGMQRVAELTDASLRAAANRDVKWDFRAESKRDNERRRKRQENEELQGPRLGVRYARVESGTGIVLQTVEPGSIAQRAGLVEGDILEKLNGEVISADNFAASIALATVCRLTRRSGASGDVDDVELRLPGKPLPFGFDWRTDAACPSTLIVTRVIDGSAAAILGLAAGDRVLTMNGVKNAVSDGAARPAAGSDQQPLRELTIEREGNLRTLKAE